MRLVTIREVFDQQRQSLLVADTLAFSSTQDQLLAACAWIIEAARDTDSVVREARVLGSAIDAFSAGIWNGLLGHAYENAVVDLLSDASGLMPDLGQALATVAVESGYEGDFDQPRVIATPSNRRTDAFLRTSIEDAQALVATNAAVLTPRAGRTVRLNASPERLRSLVEASTNRRPSWLTESVAHLHLADMLLGSSDGAAWIGVDLKHGDQRCTTDYRGVHLGVREARKLSFWDSKVEYHWDHVPGRGTRVIFAEIHLGTKGTPLEHLRKALAILQSAAGLRPRTDISKRIASHPEILDVLRPLVTRDMEEALDELRPWRARRRGVEVLASEGIWVPDSYTAVLV